MRKGNDAASSRSTRLRYAEIGRALGIYGASRAAVMAAFLTAATIASFFGDDLQAGRPWPPTLTGSLTLRALTGWDGAWYVDIARSGYGSSDDRRSVMAFFPAFPLVVRLVAGGTGLGVPAAAVLVATVSGAVAAVLLWELSRQLGGRTFADRSLALFSFFPGSFVLSMAYTEAMMLAGSLGCLILLRRRSWVLAGLCGALATATRPNAIVLVACCAWAAAAAIRSSGQWKALLAPVLSLGGILSYFAFLWRRTGDPLAWPHVQRRLWNETFSPATVVERATSSYRQLFQGEDQNLNMVIPTLGLLFMVLALVLIVQWRPPAPLVIYAAGILLLAVGSSNLGMRPRFLLTAFPLLQGLAWRIRETAFWVTLAVSAVLLCSLVVLTVVTTTLIP